MRCRFNTQDVCSVCSLPAGLLYRLDARMEAAFPGREMFFECFGRPIGFQPWERTIVMHMAFAPLLSTEEDVSQGLEGPARPPLP